jgi:LPXTG-motif cell wall-anchored protein
MSTFWEPIMKKFTPLGALALAALIAVLAMLGFSGPAQAYPEVSINLTVNRQVLYGGETFTATASSTNTVCAWTLEWDGIVRTGSSATDDPFKTTYTADEVTKITKIPLHGTCSYAGTTNTSARGAATWTRTIIITVLPRSSAVSPPGGSDLPNTGGPNLLFLAGGLALLLAGATAVTVARRRAEEAEIQASRA